MGRRLGWIGVRGVGAAEVLDSLGLVETGEIAFDGDGEGRIIYAELPSGWTIVWTDDFSFGEAHTLERLPPRCEAVACQVYDVVMVSSARGFEGGRQTWSVAHDPERDLRAEGTLPPPFAAIRDAALATQAAEGPDPDVDHVIEVPLELTHAICGFRPDEGAVPIDTVFRVVEHAQSPAARARVEAGRGPWLALERRIAEELVPLARTLGFGPVADHPEHHPFYPMGGADRHVRLREGLSETLSIRGHLARGAPTVQIGFFVRQGATPRYGYEGSATATPGRPPSWLDRLRGRAPDWEAQLEATMAEARERLRAVDRHLRDGEPHPGVTPARYVEAQPAT